MKEANLLSIVNAYQTLSLELFEGYLKYHSINIKLAEIATLQALVDELISKSKNLSIFDNYFIGYSIPQIGKEFDLLRIDSDQIVNIEFKKESTPEKIKSQILRNQYYLSFLKRDISVFTYISEEKKFYTIRSGNLESVGINEIIATLITQKIQKIENLDSYFNPSNYLVSPFNSTPEFIKRKYFLTNQQEDIKRHVMKEILKPGHSIISIKGRAGTGKSLLTYDIASEMREKSRVIVIHCGILNSGHESLRDDFNWHLIPIRSIRTVDFSKLDIVIIDEAQRLYTGQVDYIIANVKKHEIKSIFSYDGLQTLHKDEIKNNIPKMIEESLTIGEFELKNKIRTNHEVAAFIQCFINRTISVPKYLYKNVDISYFDNIEDARNYMIFLRSIGWKIINYTPSKAVTLPYENYRLADEEDNAHTVIGQDFDNVVAVVDNHFYYNGKGTLSTRNYRNKPYYHPTKMFFQIVSRTRIKLHLIIVNNPILLERSIEILKQV